MNKWILVIVVLLSVRCTSTKEVTMEKEGVVTMYIKSSQVTCEGVVPQKCMQVKEGENGDYELFYDKIKGFDYVEGYEYVLSVKKKAVINPPADGSSISYTMVKMLKKSKMSRSINGDWEVNVMYGKILSKNPKMNIDLLAEKISGNATCNRFFGKMVVAGNSVKIAGVGTTRMACQDMKVEYEFCKALPEIVTYIIVGEKLTFYDSNKKIILVCGSI